MKVIAGRFERFLRSRDLRLTKQRAEILRVIYATHRHITADELFELLQRSDHARDLKISRATVYRTLALMVEGGFVQALDLGRESGTLYEHTFGHAHHDHMICLECGRIIEFSDDRLESVQAAAIRSHGFEASSHRLNVFGTCKACVKKGKGGGRRSAAQAEI